MTYFSVGDKVHVRYDLQISNSEGSRIMYYMDGGQGVDTATKEMCANAGQEVEITSISCGEYRVSGSIYHWTDEMFEEYVRPEGKFEIEDNDIGLLL